MKILKANAGPLTNFEVLDFLRSRGAGKDPTRVIAPVAPSEFKVFDYLEQTAACSQTRESINDLVLKIKKFNLAKAEILNIINIRPSVAAEIDSIVEECQGRIGEVELVQEVADMAVEALPAPPSETESGEGVEEDEEQQPGTS